MLFLAIYQSEFVLCDFIYSCFVAIELMRLIFFPFSGSVLPDDARCGAAARLLETGPDPLNLLPGVAGRTDQDVGQRRQLVHLPHRHAEKHQDQGAFRRSARATFSFSYSIDLSFDLFTSKLSEQLQIEIRIQLRERDIFKGTISY